MRGDQALTVLGSYDYHTVLDVGCGSGLHTEQFKKQKKSVTSVDFSSKLSTAIVGNYLDITLAQHDAVWCCHVLEHQLDIGIFLTKLINDCKDGGVIAITVPPFRDRIVGGHVSLWNTGLLVYRMILAGLDLSNAQVGTYNYNCSVVTQKKLIKLPDLYYDNGDIELLAEYFPIPVYQGFDGKCINHNWI